MISHRPHRLGLRGVVLGVWLASFVAPRLGLAQCTYTGLTSGVSITTGTGDSDLQFSESQPYWSVLGVRPNASTADWDAYVYSGAIGYPFCLTGLLGSSTQGVGVTDLVVGDFNSNPTGTYYGQAHHYSADAVTSTVEWVAGSQIMRVNGPISLTTMGGSEVARIWDVFLNQGQAYHFTFEVGFAANAKLLLFRNPANAPYWAGRAGALFELGSSTAGLDFTAPASDWYGLVLVNDGSADLVYEMGVGTCSPINALSSRMSQQDPDAISYYQFTPPNALWTAAATRPDATPSGEQDLALYGALGGTAPNCFTDWRDESDMGSGGCNVLAGQSDPGSPETWYVKTQYGVQGSSAVGSHTEWDGDGRIIYVDDFWPTNGSMGPDDLVDCYNVWLEAGVPKALSLTSSSNLTVSGHVFENPGSGSYWANDAEGLVLNNSIIVPQYTGWHGVVISHDRRDTGTYSLRIWGCPGPTTLADHVPVRTTDPTGFYQFDQEQQYWTVVGTHAVTQLVDWDLATFQYPQGGIPDCFGGLVANSTSGAGTTDIVVGDFNLPGNALGTYYTHSYRYSGESDSWTEWDSGADQIVVGDPFTHTALSDSDFVRCWDVFLSAGQKYTIEFQHDAGIDAKVLLFQSNNAPYWAGRASAALQSSTTTTFTAPASDFYGLVVVNDRGSGGTDVRILAPNVAVSPTGGGPVITALTNAGPNPGRGPLALAFDLASPEAVGFDLIDVAGRVVATRAVEQLDRGSWSRTWDPFAGSSAGPGMYFLRMRTGSRSVGERKIIRLD